MKFMVMSGTDLTKKSANRDRCFETNATGLTEAEANTEAKRRNAAERAAGHTNVLWYASPQLDIASVMNLAKLVRK